MNIPWTLQVVENRELVEEFFLDGPAEFGRQKSDKEPLGQRRELGGDWRVVIALRSEKGIPRRIRAEPLAGGKVRLTNLSRNVNLPLLEGELVPGAARELSLPVLLQFGTRTARLLEKSEAGDSPLESFPTGTPLPGTLPPSLSASFSALPTSAGTGLEPEAFVRWLQAVVVVVQSAASSPDFFLQAARAVVELVQLDVGLVLLWAEGRWQREAAQTGPQGHTGPNWEPSRQILDGVLRERRTVWRAPPSDSLLGVEAVVAAPILNPSGEILGALYGERRPGDGASDARPISRLEALLVELLAVVVAAGLARLEQERAWVKLAQFFTPELARQLQARPDLLEGRDTEVTVLFCDVRGFSRVSENLGPAGTLEWIADVLGALSECVLEHGGVLVDYVGDELMAMWGAPEPQADHASRACRAALAMLGRLPGLNARWEPVLKEPMGLGIGINSGEARVGNVGTRSKFKYGPLGNTVNLGSRVQGATKYLRTLALLTQGTRAQLGPGFLVRRLCRARVVNIPGEVELYELTGPEEADRAGLYAEYEQALARFEGGQFHSAIRILGNILNEHPADGPSLVLLSRSVDQLVQRPGQFDPVWELPGK